MPATTPDELPIVAVPVAPLIHVPPAGVPDNVMLELTHTCMEPEELVIAVGNGLTVTVAVLIQPVGSV